MSETTVSGNDFQPPASLARVQTGALVAAVVGIAACVAGYLTDSEQFFRSYLVGYIYWLAIGIACLGWTMVYHLTAGGWALVQRKTLEAGARTLPVLALLFLPFWFGMEAVWEWAGPEAAHDELIQAKAGFLNVPFFWARIALYFAIWIFLAFFLSANSRRQDETGDPRATIRMRMISGPGVVVFVMVASFFSWDTLMSLEPHWFSSLYGFYFVSSTALTGMLFMAVTGWYLAQRDPMSKVFKPKHFHDYGKLMLALVMFWAYMALSQFLITWSGNVPEFTQWYFARNTGGWKPYTVFLVVFHFFVPFLMLLSASLKKRPERLVRVAVYLLAMRWIDLYWQAAPTFHEHITIHWLDLATLVAVGGVWVFAFVSQLRKRTLIPLNDPYLPEVLGHG
ncbi:MAG TPA: hypothetical protein VMV46_14600 [Thermoanaerobaculia bacterium]|nr:hypothetical protein [Thermoanaerobaculia bacterium]